jgi:hypothetical protein
MVPLYFSSAPVPAALKPDSHSLPYILVRLNERTGQHTNIRSRLLRPCGAGSHDKLHHRTLNNLLECMVLSHPLKPTLVTAKSCPGLVGQAEPRLLR